MIVRGFVTAAVLGLAFVQTAVAQTTAPLTAQTAGAARDELETLSQEWMEAAQRHDAKALGLLMAEDFTLVHPSQDRVTPRSQWLSALSRIETKQFKYEHLKVVHYGPSVAAVSAVFVVDAVMDGRPFAQITSVTDVWEKRGGKWQVVTRYAVRPEELKPSAPGVDPN